MPKTLFLQTLIVYLLAAFAEIGGCFSFWLWLRENKSGYWPILGSSLLVAFAWLLTKIPLEEAGRTFAVYGGIYILGALLWMWQVENIRPDKWDMLGLGLCLIGAGIIALTPHRL